MKMLTVSALLCVLVALTGAAALPEAEAQKNLTVKSRVVKRSTCAGRWFEFNNRCFQYIPRPMTWAKAEKNCQSMGGNLASVQNIQEYHEIQRLIMSISNEYKEAWIGGSDAQEEGVWLWSDGSLFNYMNWCPGEPNNILYQQHCIQINYGDGKCWDDISCTVTRPFVCAKAM